MRNAVVKLKRFLKEHDVPENARLSAEIIAAELLNNIVEHAYRENPDYQIALDAELCGNILTLTARDQGIRMPEDRLPTARLPRNDGPLPTLPEGGFGWYLLHTLAEALEYKREQDTNITICVLGLDAEAPLTDLAEIPPEYPR